MALLDLMLNLAVLLLWLNWRSLRLDPVANSLPTTLAGTLKTTRPTPLKAWQLLLGLCLLITLRVVVCREIGSPVDWTPTLDLGVVALAFRSDNLPTAILYALLSSLRLVLIFYFWLLVVIAVNRSNSEPDPIQRMLRSYLGRISRWPAMVQVLAPIVAAATLWMAFEPLLVHYRVGIRAASLAHLAGQGLLIGASLTLSLKYLLPAILLVYMVSSYVYLGNNPVWEFVSATSRSLLSPLKKLPLRLGKLDLSPIAGVIMVLLLLYWLPNFLQAALAKRNLTLWPR